MLRTTFVREAQMLRLIAQCDTVEEFVNQIHLDKHYVQRVINQIVNHGTYSPSSQWEQVPLLRLHRAGVFEFVEYTDDNKIKTVG